VKQQLIISGTGGQGVLFLTRLLARAGLEMGAEVLTSETHGMAMRGGTVISHVKIGRFQSPLVMRGRADTGLFLHEPNLEFHGDFIKKGGSCIVNAKTEGASLTIDATGSAREIGSLVITNLVLLGYAIKNEALFCDASVVEEVIKKVSQPRNLDMNLRGFEKGLHS
jgi:indolepyruvate ferredoxin oxidoreductase beta subunit